MKFQDIVTYLLFASAIIGVLCYQKITYKTFHLLVIYVVVSSLIDGFLTYSSVNKGFWVKVLYTIKRPFEYYVFINLFYQKIDFKYKKWLFVITVILLCLLGVFSLIFNLKSKSIAANMLLWEGIFVIIFVLFYFLSLLKSKEIIFLHKEPIFWVAAALLIFFLGNIITTGFYYDLRQTSPDLAKKLYNISNYSLNILLYIFWSIAFIISTKNYESRNY